MFLKKKIRQHRRDFTAIYACPYCDAEKEADGYDDAYFHERVIPKMQCPQCGKTGGGPQSAPDVPAHVVI